MNEIDYKKLLILSLSNIAEWKNEAEIIVPSDICVFNFLPGGSLLTCELLGDRRYIIRTYYENGIKASEEEYVGSERSGSSIFYNLNGAKNCQIEYQNNKRNGKCIRYNLGNSGIKTEIEFKNDQYHGKYTEYYENGQIKSECVYRDSQQCGKWFGYYSDGRMSWEQEFRDGNIVSRTVFPESVEGE